MRGRETLKPERRPERVRFAKLNRSGARGDAESGMTLLELIVALGLVSLVCVAIASALRLGVDFEKRREKISGSQMEVAFTQAVVRRLLEAARPIAVNTEGARSLFFSGGGNRLVTAVELPNDAGFGGTYEMTLAAPQRNGKTRLTAMFRPYPPRDAAEAGREETLLLDDIQGLSFRYFGASNPRERADWRREWANKTAQPRLIGLSITFKTGDNRRWPELLIAPRLDEAAAP